ncbi:hypothetical protein H671_2g8142 [Cricetulus griseus]|nr:hypothetical protein H671_2g8142 [Cricetulus griseus]
MSEWVPLVLPRCSQVENYHLVFTLSVFTLKFKCESDETPQESDSGGVTLLFAISNGLHSGIDALFVILDNQLRELYQIVVKNSPKSECEKETGKNFINLSQDSRLPGFGFRVSMKASSKLLHLAVTKERDNQVRHKFQ